MSPETGLSSNPLSIAAGDRSENFILQLSTVASTFMRLGELLWGITCPNV